MTSQPFYTPAELAARWGVSLRTVRSMIASGRLPAVRPTPRRVRIPAEAVAAAESRPYSTGGDAA